MEEAGGVPLHTSLSNLKIGTKNSRRYILEHYHCCKNLGATKILYYKPLESTLGPNFRSFGLYTKRWREVVLQVLQQDASNEEFNEQQTAGAFQTFGSQCMGFFIRWHQGIGICPGGIRQANGLM
jgi:hypothetical protein